jgi:hypothetical protein
LDSQFLHKALRIRLWLKIVSKIGQCLRKIARIRIEEEAGEQGAGSKGDRTERGFNPT